MPDLDFRQLERGRELQSAARPALSQGDCQQCGDRSTTDYQQQLNIY